MVAQGDNNEIPYAYDNEGNPPRLRFTLFGSDADSLRAERELAEEARLEAVGLPMPAYTAASITTTKRKPGKQPAQPGEGKKGRGNHSTDIPPAWTDAENLELLKLVRDNPTSTFQSIADKLNDSFWTNHASFAGRTINGCRPQYSKIMGGKREVTIGAVPARIKELEDKLSNN
ncbi:hypothetical protein DOTSEDRAFT_22258 [Dothistroma septosporum NZE10]|uniref:Myb-like domain-containing protein n=1 Tax=Dothistroma septosporum (strain NZE10 / CBS 128990) TaxID=675120 RepID=N1PT80_DOTSN|nr:hypothetical protein DOTSEDRAFT_22258 [Dothistroma septosporum NZE10]